MEYTKTYDTKHGKVVLIIQEGDDEGTTELRIISRPEDLGTCSICLTFLEDSEDGYDNVIKAFNDITAEKVEELISLSI